MNVYVGLNYIQPPPLPSNYVHRQILLDEIATKLLQATVDPNKYETTLAITGAGGFGKTTISISLCHYHVVKEQFTNGFVFVELGPQATDPGVKLRSIFNLLTGYCCRDINAVEHEIQQVTADCCNNLLVIIDDVWHVEDAEPIVKAFSNCKIILTTRMNDIEQYIPSKQSVIIGPMTQHEAVTLLTNRVIDSSQLSQEDMSLLDELAEGVWLWPLLLSLIRAQLSHNLKQYHLSYHTAIQNVQAKLHHKGLTAFDKNNIEAISKSRKLAVKACIETTLELLTKSLSDKIKTLILWTGIGTSLQTAVLNNLWNISKQEAKETVDALWAYGLVQFTDIAISPNNITQQCVEVHVVISQYIIESMDSNEVIDLSAFGSVLDTGKSVYKGLGNTYLKSFGVHDPSILTPTDFLKSVKSDLEYTQLPFYIKVINMYTVTDPHVIILRLQEIKDTLMVSLYTINLLSLLDEDINSLLVECKHILKDAHKLCRKLNQSAQKYLYEKQYDKLTQTVEDFIKHYPLCFVAQKAATILKKIMAYCDGELLHFMITMCENLQIMTFDYHNISTIILPTIKLHIKVNELINKSLLNGSPNIERTYRYIISGKFDDDFEAVLSNHFIKLQDVAPNYVQQKSVKL